MRDKQKIAYLIQAHTDTVHFARLINRLDSDADFFVHIDKKSDINPFKKSVTEKTNVFFVPENKRVKVFWGGFSQVKASLELIELCLKKSKTQGYTYKKIVLISGACYPIKGNRYIHDFFDKQPNINFIKGINLTEANLPQANYFVCNYLFFDFRFINLLLTRILRKGFSLITSTFTKKKNYIECNENILPIYHGSAWWALNPDVAEYILDYSKRGHCMKKYFKFSGTSDEKYFHTIFFNSNYANTRISESGNENFIHPSSLTSLHFIDDSLIKWFGINDFDILQNSDKLFVRKVSTIESRDLLNKIDVELSQNI